MDYNYHTHTPRCHHASGTPEEYILKAIEGGIKYMGFSDHAPFMFPDGYESYYRVLLSEVPDYFSELRSLREKYKDKIEIKIGFEMEYYPKYFEAMLAVILDAGAEYLILGQHFLGNEHPDGFHTVKETDDIEHLKEYVSTVISAMESGVFSYVAHPDMMNFTGESSVYNDEMSKICRMSTEKNIPLEINFQGMRNDRHYPNDMFWEIAAREKSPVTIGFDAHAVADAYDEVCIPKAFKLIERLGLNYIGKPQLKFLQK